MLGSIRLTISFSYPWFSVCQLMNFKTFYLDYVWLLEIEGNFEGKKLESKNRRKEKIKEKKI